MQKRILDFSLLKFKIQIKIHDKDLPSFFFVVLYNGFVICQPYTIYMVFTTKGFFKVAIECWPSGIYTQDH